MWGTTFVFVKSGRQNCKSAYDYRPWLMFQLGLNYCHCRDREVPQEVQEDGAQSELLYITQEYYTPVTTMRMIEGPPAIIPVGDLEVT